MSNSPSTPSHPPAPKVPAPQQPDKITRASALWVALIGGFLVLIVLLIFIAQNTYPVPLTFLGWHWDMASGVAILVAAVAGGLITALTGTVRIYQLRRQAKSTLTARGKAH
ncbi:MAG TPA: lipopolysaccharide assembly protein LapA domain-containing protein [Mycobacterium sp.]|nr:lipopolysaccharide assembly protein LapA domain-containing protein [Mycobacterium sp.]